MNRTLLGELKPDLANGDMEKILAGMGFSISDKREQLPRRGQTGDCAHLDPAIRQVMAEMFPTGLYSHQAKAIEHAVFGRNVVICTGTASGKTMAFALPVFQTLLDNPQGRALFFYPTKALAGDQFDKLQDLAARFGFPDTVYKFDGDTPQKVRQEALKKGRILLCTPDVLHATLLRQGMAGEYANLFKNLQFVILDESHIYSGAFGSNMAYLLRRLRQVCRRLDSAPQFMAASATSRDPKGHLEKLTGLQFTAVGEEENGSPSGGRVFYFTGDNNLDDGQGVIDIVAELVRLRKRFIVFCHSRRITEQLFIDLVQKYPQVEGLVMPYRSGYELEDRVQIESAMRSGSLQGVISTSALELGVDLPELEVCVLIGIPSTSMSFWQRVGRVGRSPGSQGQIIIVPSTNSIDEYYRLHPEKLFDREMEELVIHLDNWQLILAHFACARVESGDYENPGLDADIFGRDFAALGEKINELDIADDILFEPEPHKVVGIRGIDDKTFEIYSSGGEQRLGTISFSQLLREAYPRAVYRHMGEAYRVERIKFKENSIRVKMEKRSVATSPVGFVIVKERVNNGTIYRKAKWGTALEMWHTTVAVTTITSGYRERVNNQWINQEKYPSPLQRRVVSEGVWFRFGPEFGKLTKEGLNALAHALSNIFSILHPCDPAEIATHCVVNSKDGSARLYIFDTTSGGLGITGQVFDHFADMLGDIRERLLKCEHCDGDPAAFDRGCPACIQVPRWYEDNEHLSKRKALELLDQLDQVMSSQAPQVNQLEAYQKRQEGALTVIEVMGRSSDGEVAEEDLKYGVVTFSSGAVIALKSGQKGTILGSRFENNQVLYEVKMEDGRVINIKNLGGNLTLVSGQQSLMCTSCGAEGIGEQEYLCPVCGALLR